jgi:hypothetical protein
MENGHHAMSQFEIDGQQLHDWSVLYCCLQSAGHQLGDPGSHAFLCAMHFTIQIERTSIGIVTCMGCAYSPLSLLLYLRLCPWC